MPKPLTLNKLEGLSYFLKEAIDAGTFDGLTTGNNTYPDAARKALEAVDQRIRVLKNAAPASADHMPRYYTQQPGMVRMGCLCGFVPAKASARMSTLANDFMAHRRKLNLDPRAWTGTDVLYADGPFTGMNWDQRFDIEVAQQMEAKRASAANSARR